MDVAIILIPISLILGLLFLITYIWSTINGQFDDLETPAHRILLDDNITKKVNENQGIEPSKNETDIKIEK